MVLFVSDDFQDVLQRSFDYGMQKVKNMFNELLFSTFVTCAGQVNHRDTCLRGRCHKITSNDPQYYNCEIFHCQKMPTSMKLFRQRDLQAACLPVKWNFFP